MANRLTMSDEELERILVALRSRTLTTDQNARLLRAVHLMQEDRRDDVRRGLRPGDRVKWNSRRMGCQMVGRLVRTMRKNAEVRLEAGILAGLVLTGSSGDVWRVPMSILERA